MRIEIDVDALVKILSKESIFDLVTDLDDAVGSWEFTLELCEHFEKLKKEYEQESHVHDYLTDDGKCECGDDRLSFE